MTLTMRKHAGLPKVAHPERQMQLRTLARQAGVTEGQMTRWLLTLGLVPPGQSLPLSRRFQVTLMPIEARALLRAASRMR